MSDPDAPLDPVPTDDGVTHINIYSKGRTTLGQWLSAFSRFPFRHPEYGHFASMEAYWYWHSTGKAHDHLRKLHGVSAKNAGSKLLKVMTDREEFQEIICQGISYKIFQNPDLKESLRQSTLPFLHYYVYGGKGEVVVNKEEHRWWMDWIAIVRLFLQNKLAVDANAFDGVLLPKTLIKMKVGSSRQALSLSPVLDLELLAVPEFRQIAKPKKPVESAPITLDEVFSRL